MKNLFVALLLLMTANLCHAQGSKNSWNNLSNVLAVGLPVLAGADALASGDSQGLWELTLSLGATVAAGEVLKKAFPEQRPDNSGNDSFPSLHTAVAFSAARYMTKRTDMDIEYAAALYGLAALTGVARVQADKHTWGDVIAGGALGFAMSEVFTDKKNYQLSVLPTPKGVQVAFRTQW